MKNNFLFSVMRQFEKFFFFLLFFFSLIFSFLFAPKTGEGTFVLHIMEIKNFDELEPLLTDGHAYFHFQYCAKIHGPSNNQQANLSWKQNKESKNEWHIINFAIIFSKFVGYYHYS